MKKMLALLLSIVIVVTFSIGTIGPVYGTEIPGMPTYPEPPPEYTQPTSPPPDYVPPTSPPPDYTPPTSPPPDYVPPTSPPPDYTPPIIPDIPDMPNIPDLTNMPTIPDLTNIPSMPNLPTIPDLTNIPGMPNLPNIPGMPNLPGGTNLPALPPGMTPEDLMKMNEASFKAQMDQMSELLKSMEGKSPEAFAKSLDQMNELMGQTEKYSQPQLLEVLNQMDDALLNISKMYGETPSGTPPKEAPPEVVTQMTEMTQNMEKSLNQVDDSLKALETAQSYVNNLSGSLEATNQQPVVVRSNVEDIVQDINKKMGTTVIEPPKSAADVVAIETKAVQTAIDNQLKHLTEVKNLSTGFFGATDPTQITTGVTISMKKPEAVNDINTVFSSEVLKKVAEAKMNSLSLEVGNTEISFPLANIDTKADLKVNLVFKTTPENFPLVEGTPKQIVEFNVFENGVVKDVFAVPIELKFMLSDFSILPAEGDGAGIYKLNELTSLWSVVGGSVDPEKGMIRVKRSSLSQYTVMKSKKAFSDADTSWAKNEINTLLNKGVINQSNQFQPKAMLTRAEFASWIAKAYGLKPAAGKAVPFTDLAKTDANFEAVAAVYQMGIINGKSKNKFDPKGTITSDEMAVIIGKVLLLFDNKQTNAQVKSKHLASLKSKSVASWAEGDQALLLELGLSGANTFAKGNQTVTKETAAATFAKFYNS